MNQSSPSVTSLLSDLKSTVELLIKGRSDSLRTGYGAIERLRSAILAILLHCLKQTTQDVYELLWQLIVQLSGDSERHLHLLQDIYHKENIRLSVEQWIDQSVISQCLSQQLRHAEHKNDILEQYYYPYAFMRIPQFYNAFLICVRSVENSDPSLLININPKLTITGYCPLIPAPVPVPIQKDAAIQSNISSPPNVVTVEQPFVEDISPKLNPFTQFRIRHRRVRSDPSFSLRQQSNGVDRLRVGSPPPALISDASETMHQPSIPSISYAQSEEYGSYGSSYGSRVDIFDQNKQAKLTLEQSTSVNDDNHELMSSQITLTDEQSNHVYANQLSSIGRNGDTLLSVTSTSPSDQSIATSMTDYPTRTTRLPHSSLLWPKKGQTLDDYIRECDLHTRTDVEKENAHFYFSEAIISAIEQIKFTQQCTRYFGDSWSSSIASLLSPCETAHASSSSNSSSSPPVQPYIPCNAKLSFRKNSVVQNGSRQISSNGEQHDEMLDSTTESTEAPNCFDWSARSSVMSTGAPECSAEAIALTLMETWKNYKVPTASELFWMIPRDEDLPQELLPLPDGISIDPSGDYLSNEDGQRILCRGNSQWAPPRAQLIFHIHQPPNRDVQLKKQSYLCAGCGRHVEKGFAHRYRYCEYTGKYFCRICHSDKRSFLPSYIITKWDFSKNHSISNFAFDYLNRIESDPSFNLFDLNPKLFEKNKQLRSVGRLRWSLFYLHHYIMTCRFAEEQKYQEMLQKLPAHLYKDPYLYSIQDLFKSKSGDLIKVLEQTVTNLREHVLSCPLCSAKGFICEICMNDKSIIYPFDLESTSVCQVCQSCFHFPCHENKNYNCPKCQRNKARSSLTATNQINISKNIQQDNDVIA